MCRYVASSTSPSASSSRCHEHSGGTIRSGLSARVSRSCAIFKNSSWVSLLGVLDRADPVVT